MTVRRPEYVSIYSHAGRACLPAGRFQRDTEGRGMHRKEFPSGCPSLVPAFLGQARKRPGFGAEPHVQTDAKPLDSRLITSGMTVSKKKFCHTRGLLSGIQTGIIK